MERQEEIIIILKTLIGKADDITESMQFSHDESKIKLRCKQLVTVSISIQEYLNEIKSMN